MRTQGNSWFRFFLGCLFLSFAATGVVAYYMREDAPVNPEVPAKAWQKVKPHLDRLDQQAEAARNRRLSTLRDFFRERQKGAPGFAEEALSWGGKWALVKDTVRLGDGDAQRKRLSDAFARHVLTSADLQAELERLIRGYLSDLEGLENDMLVKLRADLADSELGRDKKLTFLSNDAAFQARYYRLEAELLPTLAREFGITAGREVISFVAMDIATQVILRVGQAVAVELGVSAGILGSGAASMVVTLGVGLVVGIVIDALLGELMRAFGHDPAREISEQVGDQLQHLATLLIDGEPAAWRAHDRLMEMARDDWYPPARDAARQAVDRVEKGGRLGLGWELVQQHRLRSRLHTEALRKLLLEGGIQ